MKENQINQAETQLGDYAGAIGRGLVAGLFGTAVMTVAQMIEMKITGRKPSDSPYRAVKKVFPIQAQSEADKARLSTMIHYVYGTGWGVPRALLAESGVNGVAGTLAHFGGVWGSELVMLPALEVAEPITEWKPEAVGKDVLFHAIYAIATGLAADLLSKWAHLETKKK